MNKNPLTIHHLLIVGLAATVALVALAIFRPPTLQPPSPDAKLEALTTGDMAAFKVHTAPVNIPPFMFNDADGNDVTLQNFKSKVVLLNLWATWCAPCLEEMPTLNRLQQELGGDKFEVVALSLDTKGAKAAAQMLKKLKVENLGLYIDETAKATRPLNVKGMPTTILLDTEGLEIGRLEGPAVWDSAQAKKLMRAAIEISTLN